MTTLTRAARRLWFSSGGGGGGGGGGSTLAGVRGGGRETVVASGVAQHAAASGRSWSRRVVVASPQSGLASQHHFTRGKVTKLVRPLPSPQKPDKLRQRREQQQQRQEAEEEASFLKQMAKDEKLKARLGLESVPVNPAYFDLSSRTRSTWTEHQVTTTVPPKFDTGTWRGRECTIIVQDRMADGEGGARARKKGDAGAATKTQTTAAAAAAGAGLQTAASDGAKRSRDVWKVLADVEVERGTWSLVPGEAAERVNIWLAAAVLPPLKRERPALTFGTRPDDQSQQHRLYRIKNKASQNLELTREGNELFEYVALNSLFFREAKMHGSPRSDRLFVTIAGLEPGWESRDLHGAMSQHMNDLGVGMHLPLEDLKQIIMTSPARLPWTFLPQASYTAAYPTWLTVWVMPPPQGTGSGKHNQLVTSQLRDAIDFADRTGVKLGVIGLEMEGVRSRALQSVDAQTAGEGRALTGAGSAGGVRGSSKELAGKSPQEQHWFLLRDEMFALVERAARDRVTASSFGHREAVQNSWLEDWRHEGLTLREATQLVITSRRDLKWAREWFRGYSAPYLDTTHDSTLRAVRALEDLGFGVEHRKKGKEYMSRNLVPLMEATRRFMDGDISEAQVLEELAREDENGWSVAGAKDIWLLTNGVDPDDAKAVAHAVAGGGAGSGRGGGGGGGGRGGGRAEALAPGLKLQATPAGDAARAADPLRSLRREPILLHMVFKSFRDSCDMTATHNAALAANTFLEVMLRDMEKRVAANDKDLRLLPLFAMSTEWTTRVLNIYVVRLMDSSRNVCFSPESYVMKRCYVNIKRCEELRTFYTDRRRLYTAATEDLRSALDDIDGGLTRLAGGEAGGGGGGAGGDGGGETSSERTPSASSSSSSSSKPSFGEGPLSRATLRGQAKRLNALIVRLQGFETGVTEETRRLSGGKLKWHLYEASDSDDEGSSATKQVGGKGKLTPIDMMLDYDTLVAQFDKTVLFKSEADVKEAKVPSEALIPLHDAWIKRFDQAESQLLRAHKLKASAVAILDLMDISERIDPSGIRAAVERAKSAGVPKSIVAAAEEKLAELEEEIAAFIRHRRSGDSLLASPGPGWISAGRNMWYSEAAELGQGSLGTTVYRGVYDEKAGSNSAVRRPAAIKRIPLPPGERGAGVRSLVEREVALHRHLNQNSNRVTFMLGVHLAGNDAVFTATELCGETLAQWLKRAPEGEVSNLPVHERLAAASELTAAVVDVHAAGVTHNDIKPDNCLRAVSGEFKLADLGLGVRMKGADRGDDNQYSMTTFAGYGVNVQMHGRPPEVLQGDTLTSAVDVWSLGCLIYSVFTGARSPYMDYEIGGKSAQVNRGNAGDVGLEGLYENQRIIQGIFALHGLERANLPRHTVMAARHVLHNMLQPDPSHRPSAAEVTAHPVFWSPEQSVNAIREVFDARLLYKLTPEEELRLMGDAWGQRRFKLGERSGKTMQGWKGQIVPQLLQAMRQRQKPVQLAGKLAEKLRAAADEVMDANYKGAKGRVKKGKKPAPVIADGDGTGYEDTLGDLFRFIRNVHEHPPLSRERMSMVHALGTSGMSLLVHNSEKKKLNASPNDSVTESRRVVEAYFVQTFPELPLLAHHLLSRKSKPSINSRSATAITNSTTAVSSSSPAKTSVDTWTAGGAAGAVLKTKKRKKKLALP